MGKSVYWYLPICYFLGLLGFILGNAILAAAKAGAVATWFIYDNAWWGIGVVIFTVLMDFMENRLA